MSGYIRDRWIWLSVGLALSVGSLIIRLTALPSLRQDEAAEAAEEEPSSPPTSLSLKTLRTLIDSPNPHIRQMAIDLVIKRLNHDQTYLDVITSIGNDMHHSENKDLQRLANITNDYLIAEMETRRARSPAFSVASTSSPDDTLDSLQRGSPIIPSFATPVAGWTAVPRERPSASDSDLRRRRREAVVLHEGSGEINENDIIRPSDMQDAVRPRLLD